MIYLASIIAMSPFVLVFAVMAKALSTKRTPEMGTLGEEERTKAIGFDDNDPGVDVDTYQDN